MGYYISIALSMVGISLMLLPLLLIGKGRKDSMKEDRGQPCNGTLHTRVKKMKSPN